MIDRSDFTGVARPANAAAGCRRLFAVMTVAMLATSAASLRLLPGAALHAQTTPAPARPLGAGPGQAARATAAPGLGEVEVAPLDCWWRTSVSAVTIGQPFTLVLTCAVIETETVSVVVDRARLDPRAIELAPFEVLGGSVAPDVKAEDRTFFQIQYTLRFINAAFFNQDIALPNLAVSYRVQTRGGAQAAATQGIERRFAMPSQSLRVTSLVPSDAADIRDAATLTFADLEAMSARGRLMATGGLLMFGLAAVIALVGVGRTVGARPRTPPTSAQLIGDTAILRGAARTLAAVRRRCDGSAGYPPEDIAEALAATRIVADCALERTPSQRVARRDEPRPEGALDLRLGWRGRRAIVSGSATAKTVAGAAAATPGGPARLAPLAIALAALTHAQYRDAAAAGEPPPDAALDATLAEVQRLANRLALARAPVARLFTRRAWRTAEEPGR